MSMNLYQPKLLREKDEDAMLPHERLEALAWACGGVYAKERDDRREGWRYGYCPGVDRDLTDDERAQIWAAWMAHEAEQEDTP